MRNPARVEQQRRPSARRRVRDAPRRRAAVHDPRPHRSRVTPPAGAVKEQQSTGTTMTIPALQQPIALTHRPATAGPAAPGTAPRAARGRRRCHSASFCTRHTKPANKPVSRELAVTPLRRVLLGTYAPTLSFRFHLRPLDDWRGPQDNVTIQAHRSQFSSAMPASAVGEGVSISGCVFSRFTRFLRATGV